MSFSPSAHWPTSWKSLICNTAPGRPVKRFFTLLKLNITFCFRCYLYHNCNVNPNWNYAQLYSPVKPLPNVPSSVFWFVIFCFLLFLWRTSAQKSKKIWFCYARKQMGKKEISAMISKCLCWNLFIRATTQIRAVYKDHKILATFKFLDSQHNISIVLWLLYLLTFIWRKCK